MFDKSLELVFVLLNIWWNEALQSYLRSLEDIALRIRLQVPDERLRQDEFRHFMIQCGYLKSPLAEALSDFAFDLTRPLELIVLELAHQHAFIVQLYDARLAIQ